MCFCRTLKRTSRFVQKLSPRRMPTWRRPRWPWRINVVSHATSSMLVLLKCLRHGQLIPLWPWIQSPNAPQIASLLSHMCLYKLFSDVGGVASCSQCTSWLSLGAPYTLSSRWSLESATRKVYWMRLSGFVSNPLVRWLEFTSSKSMYAWVPSKNPRGVFERYPHPYDSTDTVERITLAHLDATELQLKFMGWFICKTIHFV